MNPFWVQRNQVTSQAFRPTLKDEFKRSVYDGDLINSENSWIHFTSTLGFPSVGTLAVNVDECTIEELETYSDPEPFPEHAVIDFGGNGKKQIERKSKKLRNTAIDRGWLYEAECTQ